MARPKIELTDEQIADLESVSAVLTQKQLADYLGIARSTFNEILKRDEVVFGQYKKGKAKVISQIANNLVNKALDGDITAQIFYLKTQAGWKEQDEQITDPQPIVINMVKPRDD